MNSIITVSFNPRDTGVRRYEWDAFSSEHGFKLDDQTGMFYRNGVVAEYRDGRHIIFSAAFPTVACDNAIMSAADLWKRHGGNISASPEIRTVINEVILDVMM